MFSIGSNVMIFAKCYERHQISVKQWINNSSDNASDQQYV